MTDNKDSLSLFLKRYSTVPNTFIDDLFLMYGTATSQTDLVIDLDQAAKWLGTPKFRLHETLRRSYVSGVDFQAEPAPRRATPGAKYGGNRRLRILLTPDCFKRLCMRTASPRGELVRTYFLALEDLLAKYTKQLVEGIENDVRRLEKAHRPPARKDYAGYIYVIRASETRDGLYKIGRTKNLVQRLRAYRTGRSDDIEVLFKYRTDNLRAVEDCIKTALRQFRYRKYREVYEADLDMIKGLAERCEGTAKWQQEFVRRRMPTLTGGHYIVVDRGM